MSLRWWFKKKLGLIYPHDLFPFEYGIHLTKGSDKMNEVKTHLIADESLGGLLREYTETDRKSFEKGDLAIYKGEIREVTYANFGVLSLDGRIHIHEDNVTKLVPTEIIHVDGERFRMVDRKAEVGEKVVMHDYYHGKTGDVLKVNNIDKDGIHYFEGKGFGEGSRMFLGDHRGINGRIFTTLEPVEAAPEAEALTEVTTANASEQVIEMLANLSQRIVALEKQRDDYGERIVDLEQDSGRMLDEIDTLHRNNVRLGEELERIKAANKTHEVDAVDFNGFINSVSDAVVGKIAKGITKGGSRNA